MSRAVGLCEDFDADALRRLTRKFRDAGESQRLLALAANYEGGAGRKPCGSARSPCKRCVTWCWPATRSGPDGLIERKKPGLRFKLDEAQLRSLEAIIEEGPELQRDGVVR